VFFCPGMGGWRHGSPANFAVFAPNITTSFGQPSVVPRRKKKKLRDQSLTNLAQPPGSRSCSWRVANGSAGFVHRPGHDHRSPAYITAAGDGAGRRSLAAIFTSNREAGPTVSRRPECEESWARRNGEPPAGWVTAYPVYCAAAVTEAIELLLIRPRRPKAGAPERRFQTPPSHTAERGFRCGPIPSSDRNLLFLRPANDPDGCP